MLAGEEEAATPEFLRQRPKYYYYNQWMRRRIAEHCGDALPEAVVGRLLAMEAGELDLILHYPAATQQQASASSPLPHRASLLPPRCRQSLYIAQNRLLDVRRASYWRFTRSRVRSFWRPASPHS